MERREFVGSMLALFCATALPEPIVELIELPTLEDLTLVKTVGEVQWSEEIDEMLKRVYCDPLVNGIVSDSELMKIFGQEPNVDWQYADEPRYVGVEHYFELPPGWQAVNETIS